MSAEVSQRLVWDVPIRLFHWLIVVIIPLMWWTADQGLMDWHRRLGVTMFALIMFRLVWGAVGTGTARFAPMVRRLGSLGDYVRQLRSGQHRASYGHSPLGVLSVFALLLALSVQVGTGLFSVDVDGLESGPLSTLISFDTGRSLADIHELNFNVLLGLIALHIAAIAVYRFLLRDRLIRPMISGYRPETDFSAPEALDNRPRPLSLLGALAVAAAGVYAVLR